MYGSKILYGEMLFIEMCDPFPHAKKSRISKQISGHISRTNILSIRIYSQIDDKYFSSPTLKGISPTSEKHSFVQKSKTRSQTLYFIVEQK